MTATFESLMQLDQRLVDAGCSLPMTDFWVEQSRRLYKHPTANTYVGEVGRGGIKSGWGSRIAMNEALCGDFEVPRGEVHYWVDVSENKSEARQRLDQYEEWCRRALGIVPERAGDAIILPDLRRGFMVRAAQVGKLSGFRAFGMRIDEGAKLTSAEDGANPLPELWASGSAMLVSHLAHRPKRLLLSSPLALVGFFNERARAGTNADQVVAQSVPTWVANPSITEEQTKQLEPDRRVWLREYCAIPQAHALSALDAEDVEPAFRMQQLIEHRRAGQNFWFARPEGLSDLAAGKSERSDSATSAMVRWVWPKISTDMYEGQVLLNNDGSHCWCEYGPKGETTYHKGYPPLKPGLDDRLRPFLWVFNFSSVGGEFSRHTTVTQLVSERIAMARRFGSRYIIGDDWGGAFFSEACSSAGLQYIEYKFSQASKEQAVKTLRRWLRDRTIVFDNHDGLKNELLTFQEKVSKNGLLSHHAPSGKKDDLVDLVLLAAMAENDGWLSGSPHRRRGRPVPFGFR